MVITAINYYLSMQDASLWCSGKQGFISLPGQLAQSPPSCSSIPYELIINFSGYLGKNCGNPDARLALCPGVVGYCPSQAQELLSRKLSLQPQASLAYEPNITYTYLYFMTVGRRIQVYLNHWIITFLH